jgi:hypothetical protein
MLGGTSGSASLGYEDRQTVFEKCNQVRGLADAERINPRYSPAMIPQFTTLPVPRLTSMPRPSFATKRLGAKREIADMFAPRLRPQSGLGSLSGVRRLERQQHRRRVADRDAW